MHKTAFADLHSAAGATMVDFAGWYMPVQYSSIVTEHVMVRLNGGLFDVSHMGRIVITGPDHVAFVDRVASNGRADMRKGQVRYNLICNFDGNIQDDVLISSGLCQDGAPATDASPSAMLGDATFIVCNAGNHAKILGWLREQMSGYNVAVSDITSRYSMLALQGPRTPELLQGLTDTDLSAIKYYRYNIGTVLGVPNVMISRTGYTGEDGFELIFPREYAVKFWDALLEAGKPLGVGLAGLGARDTLRLEAGMPLYGHEIDDTVNPLEAGLGWAVKLDKDFIGSGVLRGIEAEVPRRRLVGLKVDSKRIARQGAPVNSGGKQVATVLSGSKSPTLDLTIATAIVPAPLSAAGTTVEVQIREGVMVSAEVVPLPFYKRAK